MGPGGADAETVFTDTALAAPGRKGKQANAIPKADSPTRNTKPQSPTQKT
jgi:hypothetical protein